MSATPKLPISPHAGEMPGRAEGGAVPPACQLLIAETVEGRRTIRNSPALAFLRTPLCPTGHLPRKGEIGCRAGLR
ncbi:MAG: hypothetical protein EOS39_32870 [Mesorhizobium sp.]|nr:MAG: hypothetical protein EOS39_32870 [Mesorhizobium sp.]